MHFENYTHTCRHTSVTLTQLQLLTAITVEDRKPQQAECADITVTVYQYTNMTIYWTYQWKSDSDEGPHQWLGGDFSLFSLLQIIFPYVSRLITYFTFHSFHINQHAMCPYLSRIIRSKQRPLIKTFLSGAYRQQLESADVFGMS